MESAKSIIPEIDISALINEKATDQQSQEVLDQLHTACRDIGFMAVVGHGIDYQLIKKMEKAAKLFFYLSKEAKMSISPNKWNPSNSNIYRGYFPATVFGKEGLDMCDLTKTSSPDPSCHLHEVNKFPTEFTEEQFQVFSDYFTAVHSLAIVLVKAVYKIFGADDKEVEQAFKRPELLTTFRLNYYPQNSEGYTASEISAQDGVKLACETHTDSVTFTVLYQDEVGGLQVQSPKDLSWHNVPCNPKAFVINTGKALQRMTNDKYKATFHRVLLGTEERLSIPFFAEPVADFIIDPKILVPDEEPRYEPIQYKEHILNTNKTFKEYQRD